MKIFFSLLSILFANLLVSNDLHAAFVQYKDDNGKVHYVNTQYSKVPDRYKSQVEEQLKKIQQQNTPILSTPVPVVSNEPSDTGKKNITGVPINIFKTSPTTPPTSENRLTRLTEVLNELQVTGYFPPSVNVNSGVIGYTDKSGQKVFVTAETLSSVPAEYLSQVDSQIMSLERMAQQARKSKPLIAGTTVEVFTEDSNKDCIRLLTLLEVHKIPYLNFNVKTTLQGMDFYKTVGESAQLPITRVNGQLIRGVEIAAIENALNGNNNVAKESMPQIPINNEQQNNTKKSNKKGMAAQTEGYLKVNHLIGQRE
jgi:hypothetical protein